jgi:hypothetical protein
MTATTKTNQKLTSLPEIAPHKLANAYARAGGDDEQTARILGVSLGAALRRVMLAMIDKGKPHEAHPAYWAPFVVVGEGAAAR